jgi:hypothetical protein
MSRQEKKKVADPKIVTDAVEVAEDAGLCYVSDDQPGYTRSEAWKVCQSRISFERPRFSSLN